MKKGGFGREYRGALRKCNSLPNGDPDKHMLGAFLEGVPVAQQVTCKKIPEMEDATLTKNLTLLGIKNAVYPSNVAVCLTVRRHAARYTYFLRRTCVVHCIMRAASVVTTHALLS